MSKMPPKLFISYSHDSKEHIEWVETLATRLSHNGVLVIFDQWDMELGSDVMQFMDSGLAEADRILMICTKEYVRKATEATSGGVAFEKMIMSGQLLEDIGSNRIIPIVVNNPDSPIVPQFVKTKLRCTFDKDSYENAYEELIHTLHGKKIKPRPPLGENPFDRIPDNPVSIVPNLSKPNIYIASRGIVTFDPTERYYTLGEGDMSFETYWSTAQRKCIHIYHRTDSIVHLAIARGIHNFSDLVDARSADFYTVKKNKAELLNENDIAVMQNVNGYYLAVKVISVLYEGMRYDDRDELVFEFMIAPAKSTSFTSLV
ncbi:toll/interleukin-1 receptor domain-containing protein [Pectobacterium versatile]|uniref:toll/interleukin-1 receptor domain-containing protein n=1 Tax=Pectobacterium versatile TaxID=2488639 RepID=UPI002B24A940|nr:toll/interleukin-1 receptor domain-containing protein [Pectobacterium versatile]